MAMRVFYEDIDEALSARSIGLYWKQLIGSPYSVHENNLQKRPRSVYLFFSFFACGLFEKAVYSRRLKNLDINPENQEPVEFEEIPDLMNYCTRQ